MPHNTASAAHFPVVTYGITPQSGRETRLSARFSFGRNERGLVTTLSAVSIAALALTLGGPQVAYSGFSNVGQKLAGHRKVDIGKMAARSSALETFALPAETGRALASHPTSTTLRTEQPPVQLIATSMPAFTGTFAEVHAAPADIAALSKNGQNAEVAMHIVLPQVALDIEYNFALVTPEHASFSATGIASLEDVEANGFSATGGQLNGTSLAPDQMQPLDTNVVANFAANSSLALIPFAETEMVAIDPADTEPSDLVAWSREANLGESPLGPVVDDLASRSSPVLPALAVSAVMPTPALGTAARMETEKATSAQQQTSAQLASLQNRLGGEAISALARSEVTARGAIVYASTPLHGQDAVSSPDERLSAIAVTVANGNLVSVRLDELISLFENVMDEPLFVWLKNSSATSKFVTPETLRNSGISVGYNDATKQLILSIAK